MNVTRMLPAAAVLVVALTFGLEPTAAQSSGPVATGAFTEHQAAAGRELYTANCSACHGAALDGGEWPALVGDAFTSQWIGKSAGDVYYVMSTQMPVGAPGSLKPAEYVALLAYILQRNKYPAGSTPLTRANAKDIAITSLRARHP